MGEMIDYEGDFAGVPVGLVDEICELILNFGDDADIDVGKPEDGMCWVRFSLPNGWRGGGASCEDILDADFKSWMTAHPDIELNVYCYYVENPPYDVVRYNKHK